MKDEKKPTSIDIAYLAGVSQPTVSRALRNSSRVSLATRQKVQAIAKELNYKVDVSARNLRSQKTNTIALLICEDPETGDSWINPFFVNMLASIIRSAAKSGYDLLMSFQQLSDDWSADYEDAHRADGIIFLGYGDYVSYIKRITQLDGEGTSFITWGPTIEDQPGHFLGCDNISGGYMATRHLIDLGRKRIAFIGEASEHAPEMDDRHQGYLKALQEGAIDVDDQLLISGENAESSGAAAIAKLTQRGIEFDALFCASDLIAIGAIKALQELGSDVPSDVAVVGFDDIPRATYINPPLTTVKQDTEVAGQRLIGNLLKLINGEEITSELIETELIIRNSCGSKTA